MKMIKKGYLLVAVALLGANTQSAYIKKDRDKCPQYVKCYDTAWEDGFSLGEVVGESQERYEIVRNLLNKGFTDKEIVELANTSYVEIEDVKRQIENCFGHFLWEKGYEFCSEEEFWKKKKGDRNE